MAFLFCRSYERLGPGESGDPTALAGRLAPGVERSGGDGYDAHAMIGPPLPPPRQPFYVWEEDGLPRADAARALIEWLVGRLAYLDRWKTPGGLVRTTLLDEATDSALIGVAGAYELRIELSIGPADWVCAEVFARDDIVQRAWIERAYEECELWPDGADGQIGPAVSDDPPGRIGKRGDWMQIDTLQWSVASPARWLHFEHAAEGAEGAQDPREAE